MVKNRKTSTTIRKLILLSPILGGMFFASRDVAAMPGATCNNSLIQITTITTPLSFGTFVECGGAGTVTINSGTGAATPGGCIAGVLGSPGRAVVRVTGGQSSNSVKVRITIPASATISAGANTMAVTGLNLNPGGGLSRTQGGAQTRTYGMGGIDNVSGGQAEGTYTGSLTFTALCL